MSTNTEKDADRESTFVITLDDSKGSLGIDKLAHLLTNLASVLREETNKYGRKEYLLPKWEIVSLTMQSPAQATIKGTYGPQTRRSRKPKPKAPDHEIAGRVIERTRLAYQEDTKEATKGPIGKMLKGLAPTAERFLTMTMELRGPHTPQEPLTIDPFKLRATATGPSFYRSKTTLWGTLDVVNLHSRNEFVIYNRITGHPTVCQFADNEPELDRVAEAVKRNKPRVQVSGIATFDTKHRPTLITDITWHLMPAESDIPTLETIHDLDLDLTDGMTAVEFVRLLRDR